MTLSAEETPLLFQLQTPSRKKVAPGDIFSMKLPGGYLLGRVIATNAKSSEWDEPHLHLLYIYKGVHKTTTDFQIDDFRPPQLLIPPVITNRLGWSRGVYETIGHAPLENADRLERNVFLRPGRNDYWDENANPIKASHVKDKSMVGLQAVHSYMTIEYRVSVALELGPTY
jgi:hypothetical protein